MPTRSVPRETCLKNVRCLRPPNQRPLPDPPRPPSHENQDHDEKRQVRFSSCSFYLTFYFSVSCDTQCEHDEKNCNTPPIFHRGQLYSRLPFWHPISPAGTTAVLAWLSHVALKTCFACLKNHSSVSENRGWFVQVVASWTQRKACRQMYSASRLITGNVRSDWRCRRASR